MKHNEHRNSPTVGGPLPILSSGFPDFPLSHSAPFVFPAFVAPVRDFFHAGLLRALSLPRIFVRHVPEVLAKGQRCTQVLRGIVRRSLRPNLQRVAPRFPIDPYARARERKTQ